MQAWQTKNTPPTKPKQQVAMKTRSCMLKNACSCRITAPPCCILQPFTVQRAGCGEIGAATPSVDCGTVVDGDTVVLVLAVVASPPAAPSLVPGPNMDGRRGLTMPARAGEQRAMSLSVMTFSSGGGSTEPRRICRREGRNACGCGRCGAQGTAQQRGRSRQACIAGFYAGVQAV
jgi:hypothetical protein